MRKSRLASASAAALAVALLGLAPAVVHAQSSKEAQDDARRKAEAEQAEKKKKKDKEWNTAQAPLPDQKNAGPCPYVKVLYDASRYVELKDNKESASAAGYTGEIQNVQSACEYKGADPIKVRMQVNFQLGRGPQATGATKTYKYWVAVTRRNEAVIAKTDFDLTVEFPPGADRVAVSDPISGIVIPRRDAKVGGGNFEILVGFDVTPEMAEFNREGKRFRVNAAPAVASTGAPASP
jgi:hypothetical protein